MRTLERQTSQPEYQAPASTTRRLVWFVALWIGSVTLLGAVAYGIRFWLGLT